MFSMIDLLDDYNMRESCEEYYSKHVTDSYQYYRSHEEEFLFLEDGGEWYAPVIERHRYVIQNHGFEGSNPFRSISGDPPPH